MKYFLRGVGMYKLRELEKKDLPEINRWRNDPELISLLGAPFRFINPEVDEKWYEDYMRSRNSQVRCAVTADGSDDILGLVSLVSINPLNQSAELHIMVGNRENRGKGIGSFAIKAICYHGFYNLNLHRIEINTLSSNLTAQKVYEKIGFVREGVKRQARYKSGSFADIFLYSLLKDEFSFTDEFVQNI